MALYHVGFVLGVNLHNLDALRRMRAVVDDQLSKLGPVDDVMRRFRDTVLVRVGDSPSTIGTFVTNLSWGAPFIGWSHLANRFERAQPFRRLYFACQRKTRVRWTFPNIGTYHRYPPRQRWNLGGACLVTGHQQMPVPTKHTVQNGHPK